MSVLSNGVCLFVRSLQYINRRKEFLRIEVISKGRVLDSQLHSAGVVLMKFETGLEKESCLRLTFDQMCIRDRL